MKLTPLALVAALVGQASAFVPVSTSAASKVIAKSAAMDDLKTIAEKSNPLLKVSMSIVVYDLYYVED